MTKQEIKKAIENGENVWYPKNRTIKQIDLKNTHPIFNGYQIDIMIEDENGWHTEFYGIKDLYKTKAEAEHYLHHANVTRTETLPFLTWEEFDKGDKLIRFIGKNGERCKLEGYQSDDTQGGLIDVVVNGTGSHIDYDYTEQNFYKAYDECVRLFKGEE